MRELTTKRIRELDMIPAIQQMLVHLRLENVHHEDNRVNILEMARQSGIVPAELSAYLYFKVWVQALCETCEEIPDEDLVLEQLGLESVDFHQYLEDWQAQQRQAELAAEDA